MKSQPATSLIPLSIDSDTMPDKAPIYAIAREAVLKCKTDTADAATYLLQELRDNYPDDYEVLAAKAVQFRAQELIRSARSALRNQIGSAANGKITPIYTSIDANSLMAVSRSWFDWPILPGVTLGRARKADLLLAIEKYEIDVATYQQRASFLKLVTNKLPNSKKTVAGFFSLTEIQKLAESAGFPRAKE